MKKRILLLLIFCLAGIANAAHPFLILNDANDPNLTARASTYPWSSMKAIAISDAQSLTYNSGDTYSVKALRMDDIVSSCALAYLLDPNNRSTYLQKVKSNIVNNWPDLRSGLANSWEKCVPPGSAFFDTVLAVDIMYRGFSSSDITSIESELQLVANWYYNNNTSWQLNLYGVRGIWAAYKGNTSDLSGAKNAYRTTLFNLLMESGPFKEGPGYAGIRVGADRIAKAHFMDVLEHIGSDNTYYSDPTLLSFFEWLYGSSVTPFGKICSFGDSPPNRNYHENGPGAYRMDRFSSAAHAYASWNTRGNPPLGRLLYYVFMTQALPTPQRAPSAIWGETGVFVEAGVSGRALYGALWCPTGEDWHSHNDVSAIHLAAYGEHVLRNSGYVGASLGALGYSWEYIHDTAESSNTVLINDTDHGKKVGAGIAEGFTAPKLDYACANSGDALSIGYHNRNLIFVHPDPAEDVNGYWILSDEVDANNSSHQANIALHPNANNYTTVTASQEYKFKVSPFTFTPPGHEVYLSIFLGTSPASVTVKDGLLANMSTESDCFVGKYLYTDYNGDGNGKVNVITVLFPHDNTHSKAAMTRLSGTGYTGAKITQGSTTEDIALESAGTSQVTYSGVTFQGLASWYRLDSSMLTSYFVRKGNYFDSGSTPRIGYSSVSNISVYLNGSAGRIISPGSDVTFYHPGITNVSLGGCPGLSILDSGANWVKVNIPEGTYDLGFIETTAPSPSPMTWSSTPSAASSSSISMTATTASDASGVEYYFACTAGSGHNSNWQDSANYTDTGLSPSTQYTYKVQARDKSFSQNATTYSTTASATTNAKQVPGKASNPNPANGTPSVYVGANLSWTAGSDAESHDVYFGTASPGTFQGNQSGTIFDPPGTMNANTTYYWRIDEKNTLGTTTGDVWSFTTQNTSGPRSQYLFEGNYNNNIYGPAATPVGNASIVYDAGIQSNVLTLDGNGDYLNCGNDSVTNITEAITIAAWIKTNSLVELVPIVVKGYAWRLHGGLGSSTRFSTSGPSNNDLEGDALVADGMWHHVAAVYDGTKKYLYVDGDPDVSVDCNGLLNAWDGYPFYIGGSSVTHPSEFFGRIDDVRVYDRALFKEEIQQLANITPDTTSPTPNPMTWATVPYATGDASIKMVATTASDASGVEYYFDCITNGGHDSGWQAGATYEDTGLTPSTQYTYRVKARDLSSNQNETALSTTANATTNSQDSTAPTPNPSTWVSGPNALSTSEIEMTATTASDSSGVEYFFECTTEVGHCSGWQAGAYYKDVGLGPNTTYTYRVKTRDKSSNRNESSFSTTASATTEAEGSGPVVLFSDYFPVYGDFTTGGWTTGGYSTGVNSQCMCEGTNGAQMKQASWIQKALSTSGYTNITVLYYRKTANLDSGEYLYSEWYDGTTWNNFESTQVSVCGTVEQTCGSGADNNPNFRVRFRTNASATNEYGCADAVVIKGSSGGPPPEDTTPPIPDPMTWATVPYATGSSSISMTATTATDTSGVEYLFDCLTAGGHDSYWQDSTSYTDTGLSPSTQYTYQVKARDKSSNQNETAFSTTASATTNADDTTAPSPNPMTWATVPYATGGTSIAMVATTATDVSGVEYYFDETSGNAGGSDSGWQDSTSYSDTGLSPSTQYTYQVQARDKSSNQNATAFSTAASATTTVATPTFVAAGAVGNGTGAITPALPLGIATGDILLLFLETSNQAISISNQNGGTWTEVTNSPQYCGTAADTTGVRLTAFWSRYNGTQGAPTASDSGNHQLGRIIAIRGAVASGNPWDVTAGGVEAVDDTSGSIPGATTTVDNTLVVTVIATSLPDATSTAKFSGWTNANLTSVTERTDNSANSGNGGGLGIATGIKATAGAYGDTAVTLVDAAHKGMMSIAIKP